ncbi:MAG: hypothetical protein LBJ44_05135 [Propionibacteriaceae bacterium]|jgi:hypothetical protein|nr:hypothetical protein [Propionibacteriaceae bacterium]
MSLIDRDALRRNLIDDVVGQEFDRRVDQSGDDVWLDLVAVAAAVAEQASELFGQAVLAARRADLSWSRIGTELGITRQAAQQRFGRVEPPAWSEHAPQGDRPEKVWRLKPLTFDNELEELERWGRQGWHSVGAGRDYHDVAPSTEVWEHRRRPLNDPANDLGPDWLRVAVVFPYVYYARPTGRPAEAA